MLVLSRKKGERIRINGDIEIVVVEVRGDKVRLGVEAPKDVPVMRTELLGKPADAPDHASPSIARLRATG